MIYQYYADPGGLRFVILFHEGYKWIKLLDTALLTVYTIPVAKQKKLKPYTQLKYKVMARRLRKRRAIYKKLKMSYACKDTDDAIKKLEM